jgi:hypothetical protein
MVNFLVCDLFHLFYQPRVSGQSEPVLPGYNHLCSSFSEVIMQRLLLLMLALFPSIASAQSSDPGILLRAIPRPVNGVAVINVANILNTPRAKKEGWAQKDRTEYLAGAVPVHPSVERIVLAKDVNPLSPSRGGVYALIPLKKPVDLKRFASAFQGELTTIADEPAVATPNGGFTVALGESLLGKVMTDQRQEVARWVKYIREKPSKSLQCSYLNVAISNEGMRNHVMVIIDTEDLFDAKSAGFAVAVSDLLRGKLKESQAIEAYLKSLHGFRILANITQDGIAATLQFDAKVKPGVEDALIKAFVLELLERNGAELADLPAATVKVNQGIVQLHFKMTDNELAHVVSLFVPPLPGVAEADSIAVTPTQEANAISSGKYFQVVNQILDDLKKQNQRARNFQATALWHETAAQRIETLSILGVDPAVVEYAHGTAARLRAVADSLRGTPIKATMLESKAYLVTYSPPPVMFVPGQGLRWNPWVGGNQVQTNIPQVRRAILEEAQKDANNRAALWNSIDSQRTLIRSDMAKKYGSSFER